MKLSDILGHQARTQEALQRAAGPYEQVRRLQDQLDSFNSFAHPTWYMEHRVGQGRDFEERARAMDAAYGGRSEIMRRLEEAQAHQDRLAAPRWITDPGMMAQVHGGKADLIAEMTRRSAYYGDAVRAAGFQDRYGVPEGLNAFRLSQGAIAERLALAGPTVLDLRQRWGAADFGTAFNGISAFSEMLSQRAVIGHEQIRIARQLSVAGLPGGLDVASARSFLDAAGLVPPLSRMGVVEDYLRSPRVRRVGKAERRRRLGMMKQEEAAPPHVLKAYRLIHVTERVLRRVIDDLMTLTYGDDWPELRLPLCGCKPLLKKWQREGGDVLEHADWAHYSQIMSHSQHHADVFGAGFDDPGDLVLLIGKARTLRAAVAHVGSFTSQNYLDLRLVFTTLEEGLADAMPAFEFQ